MTFTEIVTEVLEDLNLTSSVSTTRVGRKVNIRYKDIVSSLGLKTSKANSNTQASVASTNEVTFSSLNKVMRVVNLTAGSGVTATVQELTEVSWDEIREMTIPSSNSVTKYAIKRVGSITVTIACDVAFTSTAVSLRADGFELTSTLSGSTEPAFPQDFHDVLVWGVKADEYLKMEKQGALANFCEAKYKERLSKLRLYLAMNLYNDVRQSGNPNLGVVDTQRTK